MLDHEYEGDRLERLTLSSGTATFERISPDRVLVTFFDEEEDRFSSLVITALGEIHVDVEEG